MNAFSSKSLGFAVTAALTATSCGEQDNRQTGGQVTLAGPAPVLSPLPDIAASPNAAVSMPTSGAGGALQEQQAELRLAYLASFPHGSLEPALDRLGFGALQRGDTLVPGSEPSWTPVRGEVELAITRPAGFSGGIVSSNLSATPVDFPIGSRVGFHATFIAPVGPHDPDSSWAVVVVARTGSANEDGPITRAGATLNIRGATARLNTPGSLTPAGLPNLPQDVYDRIFDPTDPEPFTLELVIDRLFGTATANLRVGEDVFSRTYEMAAFRADSGPPITTVGVALATLAGSGKRTVRVRDFRVFSVAN